jgi:hypothetical protein
VAGERGLARRSDAMGEVPSISTVMGCLLICVWGKEKTLLNIFIQENPVSSVLGLELK